MDLKTYLIISFFLFSILMAISIYYWNRQINAIPPEKWKDGQDTVHNMSIMGAVESQKYDKRFGWLDISIGLMAIITVAFVLYFGLQIAY